MERRRQPSRILVHRVGHVGDLVCAIPALVALRRAHPIAHIALLTSPMDDARQWFGEADCVDEVLFYQPTDVGSVTKCLRLGLRLRRHRWDVFVELPQVDVPRWRAARDLLFAWVVGSRRVVGFATALRGGASAGAGGTIDEVTRLLEMLRTSGLVARDAGVEYRLPLDSGVRAAVDRFLGGSETTAGARCVAINPGAKRQTNRWLADRFAAVGRRLAAHGATVILTGSASERALCRGIARAIGPEAIVAAGEGNPWFTAELLRRCAVLVSNDTGTIHLAAAVGTPVVVAGSARDIPGRWDPWGTDHQVIRKTISCAPCFQETCDHVSCLQLITTDEVTEAALALFGRRRPAPRSDGAGAWEAVAL